MVVDSVAALVPKAELEGEFGEAQMGLQARLMSQAMRKLVGVVARTRTCLITGGRALKFYASMRLEVRRSTLLKDGDKAYGAETIFKVKKNKVACPFTEANPHMIFGFGFSQVADLILQGVKLGFIEKSGTWLSYKGERLGQGRSNAMDFLTANPATAQKLYAEVRAKLIPPVEG